MSSSADPFRPYVNDDFANDVLLRFCPHLKAVMSLCLCGGIPEPAVLLKPLSTLSTLSQTGPSQDNLKPWELTCLVDRGLHIGDVVIDNQELKDFDHLVSCSETFGMSGCFAHCIRIFHKMYRRSGHTSMSMWCSTASISGQNSNHV